MRYRSFSLLFTTCALVGGIAAIPACSSDDPSAGPSPDPSSSPDASTDPDPAPDAGPDSEPPVRLGEDITPAIAKEICEAQAGQISAWFDANCSAADKERPEYAEIVGDFGSCDDDSVSTVPPNVGYDPAKLGECKAAVKGLLDASGSFADVLDRVFGALISGDVRDTCDAVIVGRVAAGGACTQPSQCAAGYSCFGAEDSTPGTCKLPGAVGGACWNGLASKTHPICVDGAYCSPDEGNAGTCKAYAPKDGSCAGTAQCAPGQICLSDVCSDAPAGDVGDACSGFGGCKPGNYCASGTCKAKEAAGPAECFVGFQGLGACQGLCAEGEPTNACVAFCGSN